MCGAGRHGERQGGPPLGVRPWAAVTPEASARARGPDAGLTVPAAGRPGHRSPCQTRDPASCPSAPGSRGLGGGRVPWILASKHFHSHTHTRTLTHTHACTHMPQGPCRACRRPRPSSLGGGGHFINLEVSPGVSSSYIPDKFPSTDHAYPSSPNEGSLLAAVNLSWRL